MMCLTVGGYAELKYVFFVMVAVVHLHLSIRLAHHFGVEGYH